MAVYKYIWRGDTPQLFRDLELKPGDVIESDEPLFHGFMEAANSAASKAQAEADAPPSDTEPEQPEAQPEPQPEPTPQSSEPTPEEG